MKIPLLLISKNNYSSETKSEKFFEARRFTSIISLLPNFLKNKNPVDVTR